MKIILRLLMATTLLVGCNERKAEAPPQERGPERPLMTNGWESNDPQDLLLRSIVSQNMNGFEEALATGADPDFIYTDDDGQPLTPIIVAVSYLQKDMLIRLLQHSVNPFCSYNGVPLRDMARVAFGENTPAHRALLDLEQVLFKSARDARSQR